MISSLAASLLAFSASPHRSFQRIQSSTVIDPRDGSAVSPLPAATTQGKKTLCFLTPQLGEFDSSELAELLVEVQDDLEDAGIELRMIGIGDEAAAQRFCSFSGFPIDKLRIDPEAALHRDLELHAGPGWSAPESVPDSVLTTLLSTLPGGAPRDTALLRPIFNAWLNYMAMCAGIAAPGTLPEIARGYLGDKAAPERLAADAVVRVGSVIEIGPGVGPVRLGPLRYTQPWANEQGYQRPLELATARLRHMVEVLSNWDGYVSDARWIAQRGATFLFDEDGALLYEHRHPGVLSLSRTMGRPLTFLAPFIGAKALNPLGHGDDGLSALEAGEGAEPSEGVRAPSPPASSRAGAVTMMADGRDPGAIDVSDLGLTMTDLDAPLPEEFFADAADGGEGGLSTSGYETTSRLPGSQDQGCAWEETATKVDVTLALAGLRGQPAAALSADLTATTCTVTVFGTAVWSCVMRGEIEVSGSVAEASEGADMLPIMRVTVQKRAGAPRWGGFIRSIGEDSILQ